MSAAGVLANTTAVVMGAAGTFSLPVCNYSGNLNTKYLNTEQIENLYSNGLVFRCLVPYSLTLLAFLM
jgi:hypothetical protein